MRQKKVILNFIALEPLLLKRIQSGRGKWRAHQARDSDFSKWHPHMVLLLSAGMVLLLSA